MSHSSATPSYPLRLIAELLGTFGFLFIAFTTIALTVDFAEGAVSAGVAAGFGLGLALMIFSFGHISGGHFNPIVTLGLAAGRQFPIKEVAGYIVAQIAGAIAAAVVVGVTFSSQVADALPNQPGGSDGQAWVLELIGSALFIIVISAVATDSRAPWNGIQAPIAIGGYIFTVAIALWPVSGGGFNPARSLGPVIAGGGSAGDLWIYLTAPVLGGVIGGLIYWFIRTNRI